MLPLGSRETELRVLYNAPAKTLIAILVPREPPGRDKRVRHLSENSFRELVLPNELLSITDVAVCVEQPAMFLNVFAYRNASRAGLDFACVARVHLPDASMERLPSPVLAETPEWEGPAIPTDL